MNDTNATIPLHLVSLLRISVLHVAHAECDEPLTLADVSTGTPTAPTTRTRFKAHTGLDVLARFLNVGSTTHLVTGHEEKAHWSKLSAPS
jgi:hypothetical protein